MVNERQTRKCCSQRSWFVLGGKNKTREVIGTLDWFHVFFLRIITPQRTIIDGNYVKQLAAVPETSIKKTCCSNQLACD